VSAQWRKVRAGEDAPEAGADPALPPGLTVPLGQGEAFARLVVAARALRLHHGVLLSGSRGSGKSTAARWLGAALLCPSGPADAPCGDCRACRKVASGNHPDLEWLSVPDEKTAIGVDAVREVQDRLLLARSEGRARVLCIDPADRMTEQAQNALLKTLEEPPPGTFLVLCAARPEALGPTVRSRALPLRLLPLDEAAVRRELSQRFPERRDRIARAAALARGSLGLALELCAEHVVQLHDLVSALLSDTERLRPVELALAVLAGADGGREQGGRARLFLAILRGELQLRARGLLESQAAGAYAAGAVDPWTNWLEHALCAEEDLELQIPPEQALVGCLLRMRRAG
jgi:DNA polymerase III delta' subunit